MIRHQRPSFGGERVNPSWEIAQQLDGEEVGGLQIKSLDRKRIPAAISLSAGAYACNALMYASLHLMRRRPRVPVGFIHLPYEERQALRHRGLASMPLQTMRRAVRVAIDVIARAA